MYDRAEGVARERVKEWLGSKKTRPHARHARTFKTNSSFLIGCIPDIACLLRSAPLA
jgi:hypothetical protein